MVMSVEVYKGWDWMWLLPAEKRCSQVRLGASEAGLAGRVAKVTRIVVLAKRDAGGGESWGLREASW